MRSPGIMANGAHCNAPAQNAEGHVMLLWVLMVLSLLQEPIDSGAARLPFTLLNCLHIPPVGPHDTVCVPGITE